MTKKKKANTATDSGNDGLTKPLASTPSIPPTPSPSNPPKLNTNHKNKAPEPSTSALIICRNKYVTLFFEYFVHLLPRKKEIRGDEETTVISNSWCYTSQTLAVHIVLSWTMAPITP